MRWWHIALTLTLLVVVILGAGIRGADEIGTTREGALAALGHIREWAKWMSGIQTAAIASLVYLVFEKDSVSVRQLPRGVPFSCLIAFVFLGTGLFSSAWVLSSLSSHAIRVYAVSAEAKEISTSFDVYENSAFGWTPDWLSLGYLLSVTHWLWAVGLGALGLTIVLLLFRK